MLEVGRQLALGKLVCPKTRERLVIEGNRVRTADGTFSYPISGGVPILLEEPERYAASLAATGSAMVREYTAPAEGRLRRLYRRLTAWPGDMRTHASQSAFESLFIDLPTEALCLSIGGGPVRVHPDLVNLNLAPFPNVDVVADAYQLPYADGSVDRLHCEAVLEHLEFPELAVREMFRVLRNGCLVFAATPFIQPYHGYPDHFQNFTLSGHRRLFEHAGFTVLEAGTCVGPSFALRDLILNYLRAIVPGGRFGRWLGRVTAIASIPFLYLDRLANDRETPTILASTTYLKAVKKP